MNDKFRHDLNRYLNGEVDSIYEEIKQTTKEEKHHNRRGHHRHIRTQRQEPQGHYHEPQVSQVSQVPQDPRLSQVPQVPQVQYQEPKKYQYEVFNPYPQEQYTNPSSAQRMKEIYAIDYLDKTSDDDVKRYASELATKILKTQTKVDYYKTIKKKTSAKLEEYNKLKDEECEPLMQVLTTSSIDNIVVDGQKFTVVNGKKKRYIKISKAK